MPFNNALSWLDENGVQIVFQIIPRCRRQKNRVILQFRDSAGATQAIGSPTLAGAVAKARIRYAETAMAPKPFSASNVLAADGAHSGRQLNGTTSATTNTPSNQPGAFGGEAA